MAEIKDRLRLVVATPEGVRYDGPADLVELPGRLSRFVVLPDHAPIITSLQKGDVRFEHGGEETKISIGGGFANVRDNEVSVCVEI